MEGLGLTELIVVLALGAGCAAWFLVQRITGTGPDGTDEGERGCKHGHDPKAELRAASPGCGSCASSESCGQREEDEHDPQP